MQLVDSRRAIAVAGNIVWHGKKMTFTCHWVGSSRKLLRQLSYIILSYKIFFRFRVAEAGSFGPQFSSGLWNKLDYIFFFTSDTLVAVLTFISVWFRSGSERSYLVPIRIYNIYHGKVEKNTSNKLARSYSTRFLF